MKCSAKKKKGFAGGLRRAECRALFQKLLSFILSLCIIFAVSPTTVFAATNDYPKIDYDIYGSTNYSGSIYVSDSYNNANIKLSSIRSIILGSPRYIEVNQNEKLELTISLKSPGISSVGRCFFTDVNGYLDWTSGTEPTFKIPANFNKSSNSFSCSYIFENQREDKTSYYLIIYNPTFEKPSDSLSLCVSSYRSVVNSEEQNFFADVKEWFSNLFELLISKFRELGQNITEIGQNVGEWFSNLTESLRTFFSNLTQSIQSFFSELREKIVEQFNNMIQNLQQWFKNVGQWFSDLGKKISGFFSDLWQNFKNFFDEIGQKISDWWQSVKDFFHSLFVPEDGYFDSYKQNWETWAREHFALFYDVMDFVDDIFELFLTEFGDSSHLVITIPELSLPVLDHNVFMQETSFDFGEFINTHSSFKYLYNLYRVLISGAFYFLLLKYLQKTLSEIIVGDGDVL